MNVTNSSLKYFISLCLIIILPRTVSGQNARDLVNGNLIQFNDNGLWCWFQDERAIVDTLKNKLIVGSSACSNGAGGSPRNGANDAVMFDLVLRTAQRSLLAQWSSNPDDHNAPGFVIRPDGKYMAMYNQHYDNYVTRYRIFDGGAWASEKTFDWRTIPGGIDYTLAYNNVYYLSAEGLMYNFQRANHRAPNFIVSTDLGNTWKFGGQLTTNTSNSYNKGYYKYWGNGVDRIDFVFTEQHPRDTTTSIYHGYIKGGKAFKSDGTLVDNDIFDASSIPAFWNFSKVFSNNTVIGTDTMKRCWQSDMIRYDDGTIAAIITARTNQFFSNGYNVPPIANPDHAFIYCRYDGSKWSHTYLGKAGLKFYSSEEDYTGLGALSPNDPNTLYISTPYDPRDTSINLGVREIFKGVTSNHGANWTWFPVTQNSVRDNIRPIAPAWNKNSVALLWCRGSYTSAQIFDAAVVGIIENKNENISKMNFVDASSANTTFLDRTPLVATGPDANAGAADNKWHERTGFGNGASVFTSSEIGGENAPTLRTTISVPADGTYDLWVNFWADPTADWRIKAGLSASSMQVFRQMASRHVVNGEHSTGIILTGDQNTFLYQAYVGRVQVTGDKDINVLIDDEAVRTGSTTLTGNTVRTWYDGISYAAVAAGTVGVAEKNELPSDYMLGQNYPNPFNPATTISYQIPAGDHVSLKVFDLLGREVVALVDEYRTAGKYTSRFSTQDHELSSGIYFYRLNVGSNFSQTKKMILLR